ncbi:MAG: hypothetical protein ACXWD3_18290 [Mycobacterium sp.]
MVAILVVLSAACSSDSENDPPEAASSVSTSAPTSTAAAPSWPTSIVVLGHSGATGWNSDPAKPLTDAPENSWATGTNPDVNSVYLRALAQNPDLAGHNFNVARSGSDVDDLPRQVEMALAVNPLPDLFIIQSVDNDIRCDGSDAQNYEPYGDKMASVLASIADGAPDARIFVVGLWSTVQNYTEVTAEIPQAVADNQGGGPCDVFDPSGNQIQAAMANYQTVIESYLSQLDAACATIPACSNGAEAIYNMVIVGDDLTPDSNHLSTQGLAKMADVAWSSLFG